MWIRICDTGVCVSRERRDGHRVCVSGNRALYVLRGVCV